MRSPCIALGSLWAALVLAMAPPAWAAASKSSLPDEITATGGQGSGQAGVGTALISDQAAIHINPAMLYRHRTYDVSGSYIWPTSGRPFYRAAAIDGITSKWTAGFEYTGFSDALEARESREPDSPVRRRGSLAFAIPTNLMAIGLAGHYVEAEDPTKAIPTTIKGFTLGAGIVAQLSAGIRLGASVENFNNKKLQNISPRTLRAGVAWEEKTGFFALHADYRDRERSAYLEGQPLTDEGKLAVVATTLPPSALDHEKMVIVGGQIQTFDALRLFVATGKSISGERADVTSGGIGMFQKNFSLAYAVSRIYPQLNELQSTVSLSVTMKM